MLNIVLYKKKLSIDVSLYIRKHMYIMMYINPVNVYIVMIILLSLIDTFELITSINKQEKYIKDFLLVWG